MLKPLSINSNHGGSLPPIGNPTSPFSPFPEGKFPENSPANPVLRRPEADKSLRQAALHGDMDQLMEALASGAYVDCEDQYGNTPLLFAAARGRIPVIRHLLRVGANIDCQGRDGGTALHSAARWGKSKAVEELLRRGADALATDKTGRMALDVVKAIVASDTQHCKAGVHPPEVKAIEATEVSLNDEDNLDEQEQREERRRAAAERAREVEKWSRGLTPHEQCVAVLEDWVKMAEEAMQAEDSGVDVVVVEEEVDDDVVAEELRGRIRELTLVMGHKQTEVEVSTKQEQSTMVSVKELSQSIKEAEAKLNLLSDELEKCQGVAVSARTSRLLSSYDLAKIRLERVEKEIDVARLEGRPDVKEELETLLPSLKEQKKKAQHACRHLLRDRKRQTNHHESFRDPLTPTPEDGSQGPEWTGSPHSHSTSKMKSKPGEEPVFEDYTAFELPDRFGGKVPIRLNLNDDAWRAIDSMQTTIDRLRRQVRFLGGKPHC